MGVGVWHYKFDHLNFRDLYQLKSKGMVHGFPSIQLPKEVYGECLEGKQNRKEFESMVDTKAKVKLEIVYSDVYGSIQVDTLSRNKYFVSFIDNSTRKIWIFLIKQKNEVFEVFEKFKALVEKQSICYIKGLRKDGGGEFTANKFDEFLRKKALYMR